MKPMTMRDVLYVPRLKKNLISISTIEDRGFVVYFLDGNVHIYHKGSSTYTSIMIGFICGKICKLLFRSLNVCNT